MKNYNNINKSLLNIIVYVTSKIYNFRIKEYHGLMILLFAEIESLRQRVSEKEAEMNNLRRSTI